MTKYSSVGFLFDLDGVLIDSEKTYTKIWSDINDEFPSGYPDLASRIKGTTLESILSTYYPDPDVRSRVEKRLYERENTMVYNYTEGAKELLSWLKTNRIPVALVTSSNDIKMRHLWSEIPGMEIFFDVIVTGDLVTKSKPDPEGYNLAASKLGVPKERCVVFEDSLQGVRAGRSAGGLVVGVVGTLPADVLRPYADILVDNLEDINKEELVRLLDAR